MLAIGTVNKRIPLPVCEQTGSSVMQWQVSYISTHVHHHFWLHLLLYYKATAGFSSRVRQITVQLHQKLIEGLLAVLLVTKALRSEKFLRHWSLYAIGHAHPEGHNIPWIRLTILANPFFHQQLLQWIVKGLTKYSCQFLLLSLLSSWDQTFWPLYGHNNLLVWEQKKLAWIYQTSEKKYSWLANAGESSYWEMNWLCNSTSNLPFIKFYYYHNFTQSLPSTVEPYPWKEWWMWLS